VVKKNHIVVIVGLLLGVILMSGCNAIPGAGQVKDGNTVQVNYTGRLADGTVFDTSVGRTPLEFTLGAGKIIPGFEKAVLGMKVGEKKTVTIPVNEAYGPHRDELVMEISREELPSGMTPQVGQQLQAEGGDGSTVVATITKISDTTVTLDANHPLAGKDLTFKIELVKIE
jgi:peptidylprolyl isomerase